MISRRAAMFSAKAAVRRALHDGCRKTKTKLRSPNEDDVKALCALVKQRGQSIVTRKDAEALERHNTDWTRKYVGKSQVVVKPQSTEEVSAIVAYCHQQRLGVVPQAGNTGLVGGSVPIADELILSVAALDTIHSLSDDGILVCGSGCVLQRLQDHVSARGHFLPIDVGAKGTCMIGGNVSTNAGGHYTHRFGSIHANILGLQVVLPQNDGTVLDLMNCNRKDNTGYHLHHLFVGAEGTLGVITKVVLACPKLPNARNAALLACGTFASVRRVACLAKQELGDILSALEFMDRDVLDFVAKVHTIPITDNDFTSTGSNNYPFYLLLETLGSNNDHDVQKLDSFLETCMDEQYVSDGVVAQDMKQVQEMWAIRESCNPVVKDVGYNYKFDVSLPISEYYGLVEEMRHHLLPKKPQAKIVNWGHILDGNLHCNVVTPGIHDHDPELSHLLEPRLFEAVVQRGGSISAEHGLGQCKNNYLGTALAKGPTALSVMTSIKSMFDPHGIMNPGKYFPHQQNNNHD